MNRNHLSKSVFLILLVFFLSWSGLSAVETPGKKILTFQDIMRFKELRNPAISPDGTVVTYATLPGRGDGEALIHNLKNGKKILVERGSSPLISSDSLWVAVQVNPSAAQLAGKSKNKPKRGMALVNSRSGEKIEVKDVERFSFSEDGRWLGYQHFKEEKPAGEEKGAEDQESQSSKKQDDKKRDIGTRLILKNLNSGEEKEIPFVLDFTFDDTSRYLAFTLGGTDGTENGLLVIDLQEKDLSPVYLLKKEDIEFGSMAWKKQDSSLAFILVSMPESGFKEPLSSIWSWDGRSNQAKEIVGQNSVPKGWMIPKSNGKLEWGKKGDFLFFGLKPLDMLDKADAEAKEDDPVDLFNEAQILSGRGVDVWHWNDPFINSHQKKNWPRLKNQTYLAVFHMSANKLVQLSDRDLPTVLTNDNSNVALGTSDVPYRKEVTWDGRYSDVFVVNLKDGKRTKIFERLEGRPSLSPDGKYVLYYNNKHWFLYDVGSGKSKNLTADIATPFFDEDHDYPSAVSGYGVSAWYEGDRAVLINDKYDIWKFETSTGKSVNQTDGQGREGDYTFRLVGMDREARFLKENQNIVFSSYHNWDKHFGFYAGNTSQPGVRPLLEEKKKFRFLAKAKDVDVLIFTRESFKEFPDILVSDTKFRNPKKVSLINPQIQDFAWGEPELVEWSSLDGIPLQGVLIKPAGYKPGKKYPVIVYFYRFFSQRMYEFNQMLVNHRPNFPFYTSNGYAVFLPDIRFEVGHPGYASTKCLVPGVQKLIDMGVADPKAIGLHGHSWSGYQTAHIVTQTNLFTCSIAGAPVSNMTSAYGGIRWDSGLSRQFQYEKTQSRIGGTLWEKPELYIENSPLFFADRIQTPMLIMFGDVDGAVPWYQGIELYMALRRLGKDCIFLQYRGEPHHPQKYANKLDYSIKMKEYFDHYLKGKSAPEWIKAGVPYWGK
ncbi:prolyl oligopeptidase family serine peptidase [Acidobacteriota bacterium]